MGEEHSKCESCGCETPSRHDSLCDSCRAKGDATIDPTPKLNDNTVAPSATMPGITTSLDSVGDYDLIEEIARGGMGVVYKANHRSLNRIAAVKMVLGGRFSSAEEVQRFRIEAESAAKLDHPAIVPIYEIGECDGKAFFAMKYIDGGSLAEKATSFKDRPREATEIMIKVAEAVGHAHQRGVLHRDLKPANILLDKNNEPFVTDLGLAKSTTGGSDLTHTGVVLGTPRYMPPEQASGHAVTTAADVYSLGAILYELITGKTPYEGDNSVSVVMKVLDGPPIVPSKANPNVDRDLELVCLKCISREPANRYSSAQAFADDLKSWLNGESLSVQPPSIRAKVSSWIKRNPSLTYGIFATLFGFFLSLPFVLTFFSDNLGEVYDRFPDGTRPLMYSVRVPNFISVVFAVILFLVVWPSIGLLNAVISKPRSLTKATLAGLRISSILSLIFYVVSGWLVVIQGVNNYSHDKIEVISKAVWPADEDSAVVSIENANQLFGGLNQIPVGERADVVARRIRADRYASFPYSLGVAVGVILVFSIPIIYGTVIGASLKRRGLPIWLFLLRYLIAWWTLSVLLISTFLTIMTALSRSITLQSRMSSVGFAYLMMIVIVYLTLRTWKKAPKTA